MADHSGTRKTIAGTFTTHSAGALTSRWDSASFGPIVFAPARAEYAVGTSPHGGIPLCFPWFGPPAHADAAAAPERFLGQAGATVSHGFARLCDWRLTGTSEDGDGAWTVGYRLTHADVAAEARAGVQPFVADLRTTFGDTVLTVSLTVGNTGTDAFRFEEALHTYFLVSDVSEVAVEGLDGLPRVDAGGTGSALGAPVPQRGPIGFGGPVAQIYATDAPAVLVDRGLERRVTIASTGSNTLVVWNPGPDVGERLPDLAPGDWRRFVCVETGNARDAAVRLAPGQSHRMTARYSVGR